MHSNAKPLRPLVGSGLAAAAILAFALGAGLWRKPSQSIGGDFSQSGVGATCADGANAPAVTFYNEMSGVNARMHAAMAIAPSGNTDRDFARSMIPHHQGAIEMALLEPKYGRDERLKRLAQSVIVEQGQEIAYMRALLETPDSQLSATNRTAGQ